VQRISEEKLTEIRQSVDIVDIIGNYLALNKHGRNYFGICPFHDDTTPSLSVSPEKQIFKCFSCGASGNVYTFLMEYEQLTFLESVKKISEIANIPIDIKFKEIPKTNQELYNIYETTQKFYRNNLETKYGEKVKKYLKQRNINEQLIQEFGIGLALKENQLTNFLKKKNFNNQDLLLSGLINEKEQDIFYNRIMFPIHDQNGKIIAYSGRIYQEDTYAKYINTKETPIFKKGEILYNYHRAKEITRLDKKIIVLEGFMDVIALAAVDIKNCVATMGTAMTLQQARLIKKLANEVILLFDGDEAGQKATLSAIDELLKVGITPKIVSLEEGLDPDDYLKEKGIEKFQAKLETPQNMLDFQLSYFKKGLNLKDEIDTAKYIKLMLNELSKINDKLIKELAFKKLSDETGVAINFLKKQIKEKIDVPVIKKEPSLTKYELAERYLLYYMLKSSEIIKIYRRRITYMPTYDYRLLAIEISEFYEKYGRIDVADIFTIISDNEKLTKALKKILQEDLNEEYTLEQIEDYINVINEFNLKAELDNLKTKLKATDDSKEKAKIAEKIRLLKRGDE